MTDDSARLKILQRLRRALKQRTNAPYPEIADDDDIFAPSQKDLALLFAEQLKALGGHFVYCEDNNALVEQFQKLCTLKGWKEIHCADARLLHLFKQHNFEPALNSQKHFSEGSVGISACMQLVARTGSILFSSVQVEGRGYGIAPDSQVVIASSQQLVYNIKDALANQLERFNPLPSMICLTTGASRTADIEKTLVMGAHGPKEIYVFYVDL